MSGFGQVANLESQRNQANETLKANFQAAEKSQDATMMGSGAAIGMMAGGPVGAAIGAAGGYLLSQLF